MSMYGLNAKPAVEEDAIGEPEMPSTKRTTKMAAKFRPETAPNSGCMVVFLKNKEKKATRKLNRRRRLRFKSDGVRFSRVKRAEFRQQKSSAPTRFKGIDVGNQLLLKISSIKSLAISQHDVKSASNRKTPQYVVSFAYSLGVVDVIQSKKL